MEWDCRRSEGAAGDALLCDYLVPNFQEYLFQLDKSQLDVTNGVEAFATLGPLTYLSTLALGASSQAFVIDDFIIHCMFDQKKCNFDQIGRVQMPSDRYGEAFLMCKIICCSNMLHPGIGAGANRLAADRCYSKLPFNCAPQIQIDRLAKFLLRMWN